MPRRSLGIMRRRFTYQGSKANVDALHARAALLHIGLSELFDRYMKVIALIEEAAHADEGSIEVYENGDNPNEIVIIWSGGEGKTVIL